MESFAGDPVVSFRLDRLFSHGSDGNSHLLYFKCFIYWLQQTSFHDIYIHWLRNKEKKSPFFCISRSSPGAFTLMADPLSIAASIAGLVGVAESFIRHISGYISDVQSFSRHFRELSAEVEGLCGVLLTFERAIKRLTEFNATAPSAFQGSCNLKSCIANVSGISTAESCLKDCQALLNKLTETIEKNNPVSGSNSQQKFKKFVWSFNKSETASLIEQLIRHKQTFLMAIGALTLYAFVDRTKALRQVNSKQKRRRRQGTNETRIKNRGIVISSYGVR